MYGIPIWLYPSLTKLIDQRIVAHEQEQSLRLNLLNAREDLRIERALQKTNLNADITLPCAEVRFLEALDAYGAYLDAEEKLLYGSRLNNPNVPEYNYLRIRQRGWPV